MVSVGAGRVRSGVTYNRPDIEFPLTVFISHSSGSTLQWQTFESWDALRAAEKAADEALAADLAVPDYDPSNATGPFTESCDLAGTDAAGRAFYGTPDGWFPV